MTVEKIRLPMHPYLYAGLPPLTQHNFLNCENSDHLLEAIPLWIANRYKCRLEDLTGNSRKEIHTIPRQIAMYLIRHKTDLIYRVIGKYFNRDHSSVIYGCQCVEDKISINKKFKHEIEIIIKSTQLKTSPLL